ncbi:hypothetical protein ACFX15_045066 [Malus domestica]
MTRRRRSPPPLLPQTSPGLKSRPTKSLAPLTSIQSSNLWCLAISFELCHSFSSESEREREVKGKEEEPCLNLHLPCSVAPTVNTFVITLALNHHQEKRVYVPELNFEHLLTSSNYYDTVKKTTGGCNGYCAKLTNIFSIEFIIETMNVQTGIKLRIP